MLIDELIEKAFSDGYEYAQREFNKKKKIDLYDRAEIAMYKIPGARGYMDPEEKDSYGKRAAKGAAIGGAALGAMSLPAAAALSKITKNPKLAAKVAAASTLAGAAGGAIGGVVGTGIRRGLRKTSKKYDELWKKQADKAKVAHGEMSKEEYAEKYGK
jgi:hypothetical protein